MPSSNKQWYLPCPFTGSVNQHQQGASNVYGLAIHLKAKVTDVFVPWWNRNSIGRQHDTLHEPFAEAADEENSPQILEISWASNLADEAEYDNQPA